MIFRNQDNISSFSSVDGEEKLIKDAILGEASAFGRLYDCYQPRIYRFILVKVDRSEEAEDLTHQVFLKAWQNIADYKHRGFPFSSWLYRIARNQVIDYYRTKKAETDLEQVDKEFSAGPAAAYLKFEKNWDLERVWKALKQLEPSHQEVIVMRFIDDLSIKETAAAIRKSQGAVKLLQFRALNKLREIINS